VAKRMAIVAQEQEMFVNSGQLADMINPPTVAPTKVSDHGA